MEILKSKSSILLFTMAVIYFVAVGYYAIMLQSRINQRDVTIAMWQDKAQHYEVAYNDSVSSCALATSKFLQEESLKKELKVKNSQIKVQERLKDIVYSEVKPNDKPIKVATPIDTVDPNIIRMLNAPVCAEEPSKCPGDSKGTSK
ncbi:hypothetical protein vB_PsyM_KIL4_0087 [Pseudomonas phage vB_PsyM_KIL4]|uniref:Uncharacterized protein n=4 Tax=Flaumdravirus TaxID=2560133 RepID=A0A142IF06_9CAUD|nr:hypothetical protein BH774_gp119 [Pseudomonas phage vB_PsyM_KIL1]YP_009616764.1 hypothetical protein FDI83_gp126 [Pseudomonas phage vB_PsyM_KIL4]AMR57489.1 hypothetical protein vB_PsyM_KIL2_0089 [Pseudomonas phage vB_PsyM_KIL2]AMR57980.1 hypothetical protein vB_PsyM_KIL5_0089 [Pseudomonas phage vB_PsyM_KIL5]AMR57330.1 hypothetical protein vB_PsyM_KIL1_0083 [Pseudomonas phage vB_PsyM_KIL1]AMR57811.1 hypothetical protein vB_PsyM_KIL4_0087 [Pseudomonas phage vB_PsyM_KIL4]